MMPKYIRYKAAAERLAEVGSPTAIRTLQSWADRYPELKHKIAGRGVLRVEVLDQIIAGKSLAEVAAHMRELAATERPLSDGGGTSRE